MSFEEWWNEPEKRKLVEKCAKEGTPAYIYDVAMVRRNAQTLQKSLAPSVKRVFYAIKANPNADIIRAAAEEGLGLECVSIDEVELVFRTVPKLSGDRVLFTPNFAPRTEYERAFAFGVHVTVDNVYALEHWQEVFRGREITVRVDPGKGDGHHSHVKTAGASTKFGVDPSDFTRVRDLVAACGAKVVGLHAHVGSGILHPEPWAETLKFLAETAKVIAPNGTVRHIDIGGGYGVVQNPSEQSPLDLTAVERHLAEAIASVRSANGGAEFPHEVWTEPGRYVVAQAGILVAHVTQLKSKGSASCFVGIDAGMNSLMRPALYGAYHHVVNFSRSTEPHNHTVAVVGPICESGDFLNGHAALPEATCEGDIIVIATAGAYGRCMSSSYNCRAPARECVL